MFVTAAIISIMSDIRQILKFNVVVRHYYIINDKKQHVSMYVIYEIEAILWEHGDSVGQSFTSLHKFQRNYGVISLVDYWFFKRNISMTPNVILNHSSCYCEVSTYLVNFLYTIYPLQASYVCYFGHLTIGVRKCKRSWINKNNFPRFCIFWLAMQRTCETLFILFKKKSKRKYPKFYIVHIPQTSSYKFLTHHIILVFLHNFFCFSVEAWLELSLLKFSLKL